MANILYRGSSYTTANTAGSKNAPLTNDEIDRNFYSLDSLKFDKAGGSISGTTTFGSDVTIAGNLVINGTTTTVNTVTLSVKDINIELGVGAGGTNTAVDGAGLTVKGATDKTFNWVNSTTAWTSSEHLRLAAGKQLQLLGSTSGVATISAPPAAGTPTLTLPTSTGTLALTSDIGNGTMTVTAGSGLTGGGQVGTANQSGATSITISHADTSAVADLSSDNAGNTFIQDIAFTFDTYGHVTGASVATNTVTIGNGAFTVNTGSGLTGGAQLGTANQSGATSITISHADTSTQASVDNSNGNVVQDITLDDFGHITAIASVDLDTRYYTKTGADDRYVNITGDTMTGRLVVPAGNTGGIAFPNNAFGGTGDSASITLENPTGGEATRMIFQMTNDVDDIFYFYAPSDNGMQMNGYTIWHAGNLTNINQLINGPGYITTNGRAYPRRSDGGDLNFYWSGQAGQPTWLWGGSDGTNMYVYNPSNFSVNYATTSGYATGARRLYRSDSAVDSYNVQSHWDGSYWELKGYNDSTYHAGCKVAYATSAGSAGSAPASDVYTWAKQPSKPTYTASEVGAAPSSHTHSYLPLSGGTLSGTLFLGANSINLKDGSTNATSGGLRARITANENTTSPAGYNTGGNSLDGTIYIETEHGDVGGLAISADGATLYNSGDRGYLFRIVDEDTWQLYSPSYIAADPGVVGVGPTKLHLTSAGDLTIANSFYAYGNVTAYSDARIKTNVQKIDNALEKVEKINGYTFDRTDIQIARQTGVIAQEILEVLPEAVGVNENGLYNVAYGNMVGLLIEAIKELNAKVEDLQNQLANK